MRMLSTMRAIAMAAIAQAAGLVRSADMPARAPIHMPRGGYVPRYTRAKGRGPKRHRKECGRYLKKPGRQERDDYGRFKPYGPRQVHIIKHRRYGLRWHVWTKNQKTIENARAGEYGRCTLEFVNGFGQVTARERITP